MRFTVLIDPRTKRRSLVMLTDDNRTVSVDMSREEGLELERELRRARRSDHE